MTTAQTASLTFEVLRADRFAQATKRAADVVARIYGEDHAKTEFARGLAARAAAKKNRLELILEHREASLA